MAAQVHDCGGASTGENMAQRVEWFEATGAAVADGVPSLHGVATVKPLAHPFGRRALPRRPVLGARQGAAVGVAWPQRLLRALTEEFLPHNCFETEKLTGFGTDIVRAVRAKALRLRGLPSAWYLACSQGTSDAAVDRFREVLGTVRREGRFESIRSKWYWSEALVRLRRPC